jgi:hypothetical protein
MALAVFRTVRFVEVPNQISEPIPDGTEPVSSVTASLISIGSPTGGGAAKALETQIAHRRKDERLSRNKA